MTESTARFVKRARTELGLSQVQLAKLLKVTRESIGRWESGQHDMRRAIAIKLDDLVARRPTVR